MKQIWAPWRMVYVTQTDKQDGCVFCEMACVEHAADHCVLARAHYNYIILNVYPYNSGHLMVVPYKHESDFTRLPAHTAAEMMALAQLALIALQQEFRCEGANIGLNIGKAAGAGIKDHIHLHVVPRWTGDTNFMTALAETRVVPQSLEAAHQLLAPVLQCLVEEQLPQMLTQTQQS